MVVAPQAKIVAINLDQYVRCVVVVLTGQPKIELGELRCEIFQRLP